MSGSTFAEKITSRANATNTLVSKVAVFPVSARVVSKQKSTMAEQTKKSSMTTDRTSEMSETPKKNANSLKRKVTVCEDSLDLWEVWSRDYGLPPLGSAKANKTYIFEITTFRCSNLKTYIFEITTFRCSNPQISTESASQIQYWSGSINNITSCYLKATLMWKKKMRR